MGTWKDSGKDQMEGLSCPATSRATQPHPSLPTGTLQFSLPRTTSLPPVQFWKGAVLPLLPQETQILHPSSPHPFPRRFPLSHGGWFALAAFQLPAAVTSGARKSSRWGMGAGPRKEQTRAPKPRPSVRKCPESRYTHCPARGQEPATSSPCQIPGHRHSLQGQRPHGWHSRCCPSGLPPPFPQSWCSLGVTRHSPHPVLPLRILC